MKCAGTNTKGEPCKLPAKNGEYCRYHCVKEAPSPKIPPKVSGVSSSKLSSKLSSSKFPVSEKEKEEKQEKEKKEEGMFSFLYPLFYGKEEEKKGEKEIVEHYRGVDKTLCYENLGYDCQMSDKYYLPGSHMDDYYKSQGKVPYPEEFITVANELMKACQLLNMDKTNCVLHPITPAIQWNNSKDNTRASTEKWKQDMHNKGNHYFHSLDSNSNFPKEDKDYCYCQETRRETNAFQTLKGLSQKDWEEIHGETIKGKRTITPSLRTKIVEDSLIFLSQEYKIHLQPKPEYQIPILLKLIESLKGDPEFLSLIDSWKAIIPYNRVVADLKLPSIVIYPVWGKENARRAVEKVLTIFAPYDSEKIGLNITPRYNYRYNSLIYWAGGAGDWKGALSEKYFSSPEKIFFKGAEIGF